MRKISDITGEWRRQHNEEIYTLYSSSNVIQVIKSERISWAGNVAYMGDRRCAYSVSWGDLTEFTRRHAWKHSTWGIQVVRYPNFFLGNGSR